MFNSPVKPTHGFSGRCIKQEHGGWCPECNHLVSWMHGCRKHEIKKDALLKQPAKLLGEDPSDRRPDINDPSNADVNMGTGKKDEALGKPRSKRWKRAINNVKRRKTSANIGTNNRLVPRPGDQLGG